MGSEKLPLLPGMELVAELGVEGANKKLDEMELADSKNETRERPQVILLVQNKDNSEDDVDQELLTFGNKLEEMDQKILLINDPKNLPAILATGVKVEAVVVKIDKESDLFVATMVKGFVMNCPLLSKGSIIPPGFKKITEANEVLYIVKESESAKK